jgi:hypothetical protein
MVVASVAVVTLSGAPAEQAQPTTPWTLVDIRGHGLARRLRRGRGGHESRRQAGFARGGRRHAESDLFENPSWTRHVIASGIQGLINAAAFDIDKDGIPEIAAASGFATEPAKSSGVLTLYTHTAESQCAVDRERIRQDARRSPPALDRT